MSRRQDVSRRQKAESSRQRNTWRDSMAPARTEKFSAFCLLPSALCSLQFHITNIHRLKSLQEPHRFIVFEFRILRFNHQKETVARRQRKVWGVEYRMIRLRQLIQRQHSEYRRKRRHQHRAFKRNRNECRPTIKWFAADIDGIVDHFHPVLHEKSTQRAEDTARQND